MLGSSMKVPIRIYSFHKQTDNCHNFDFKGTSYAINMRLDLYRTPECQLLLPLGQTECPIVSAQEQTEYLSVKYCYHWGRLGVK